MYALQYMYSIYIGMLLFLNNFIVCGFIVVVLLIIQTIFQKANNCYLVFATAAVAYEV